MKKRFPGYFRPAGEEFRTLWERSLFVFDTNVLLNLYRYSVDTRESLKAAIKSVQSHAWLTHQAAKEFLSNRLIVTSGQAKEYDTVIENLKRIQSSLRDTNRHPFLSETQAGKFEQAIEDAITDLGDQKARLLETFSNDPILEFVSSLFQENIGKELSDAELSKIYQLGEERYERKVPPGYMDGAKDKSGDLKRKFGDLIIWNEMIQLSKEKKQSMIFVTDDRKEDWWLEHSGKTFGPRPELIEEFLQVSGQQFYMYNTTGFLTYSPSATENQVSNEVLDEIQQVLQSSTQSFLDRILKYEIDEDYEFRPITESQLLTELSEYQQRHIQTGGYVGLKNFVRNYLGPKGYEYNHSYGLINSLEEKGKLEIYKIDMGNYEVAAIRVIES